MIIIWAIFEPIILEKFNILYNNKLKNINCILLSIIITIIFSFLYYLFFKNIIIELFFIRIILFFFSYFLLTYFYYNKCEKYTEINICSIFLRIACVVLYFPF